MRFSSTGWLVALPRRTSSSVAAAAGSGWRMLDLSYLSVTWLMLIMPCDWPRRPFKCTLPPRFRLLPFVSIDCTVAPGFQLLRVPLPKSIEFAVAPALLALLDLIGCSSEWYVVCAF